MPRKNAHSAEAGKFMVVAFEPHDALEGFSLRLVFWGGRQMLDDTSDPGRNSVSEYASEKVPVGFIGLGAPVEMRMADGQAAQGVGGLAVIVVPARQAHGEFGMVEEIRRFAPGGRIERAGLGAILDYVCGESAETEGAGFAD